MPRPHVIQWPDNGFGVQILVLFLEQIGVRGDDEVELSCQGDRVVIRRTSGRRREAERDK